jgi:hypothetical protein
MQRMSEGDVHVYNDNEKANCDEEYSIMTRSCGYVRWNVDVRDLSLNQDFEGIGSLSHTDVEEIQYWELILRRI